MEAVQGLVKGRQEGPRNARKTEFDRPAQITAEPLEIFETPLRGYPLPGDLESFWIASRNSAARS
jgi:hypothetical protein